MKKKTLAILLTALFVAITFAACSPFKKIAIDPAFKQEYDYVVKSNGGSAVQYGDYIYFINGAADFTAELNTKNEWNTIIKGGLYKAKLHGARDESDSYQFVASPNDDGFEFVSHKGIDYTDGETEIDVTTLQLIAPKVIGTTGYDSGGIFIYDEWIYYATPNNSKNREGAIQTTRTDFMRTKLDGTKTQKLYTTEGDSADKPYAFYKQNGKVYLVCAFQNSGADGTDAEKMSIISVAITGDKQPKKKNITPITNEATSVLLPARSEYDSRAYSVTLEDYIFFTRAVKKGDTKNTGNVAEICLPSGDDNFEILAYGQDVTLLAVSGDTLFYKSPEGIEGNAIFFTNLYSVLYNVSGSDDVFSGVYTDYENSLPEKEKRSLVDSGVTNYIYNGTDIDTFTTMKFFRDNIFTDVAYMLAFTDNAVKLYSNDASKNKTVLSEAVTFHTFDDNGYMYFTSGADTATGTLYKAKYLVSNASKITVSHTEISASNYKADYVGGFIMYFAGVDEWASDYAYFLNQSYEGATEILAFERSAEDVKPDEDEDTTTEEDAPDNE